MLDSIYLTFPMAMHCNDLPVLLHCTKVLDRVPFVEVELLPIMPLFFSSSAASAKKVEKDDIISKLSALVGSPLDAKCQ